LFCQGMDLEKDTPLLDQEPRYEKNKKKLVGTCEHV